MTDNKVHLWRIKIKRKHIVIKLEHVYGSQADLELLELFDLEAIMPDAEITITPQSDRQAIKWLTQAKAAILCNMQNKGDIGNENSNLHEVKS